MVHTKTCKDCGRLNDTVARYRVKCFYVNNELKGER
jgi:hypothetical protein